MALAESIAMTNFLNGLRVSPQNPLEAEVEHYLSMIQTNLQEGHYSPQVSECIEYANLRYAYMSTILPMGTPKNNLLKNFRDDVRKLALNGISCEEIYSIVDGIEQKVYH